MTNLTKAEISAVAHAAAKPHLSILIPVLQRLTEKMDLGGRK